MVIVGFPCRRRFDEVSGREIQFVQREYIASVVDFGKGICEVAPLLIPCNVSEEALRKLYSLCDAVLLTGGEDICPEEYSETPHELLGCTDNARDFAELRLARWCFADKKPALGICRGLQVMNVALGGSLFQDVQAMHESAHRHMHWEKTHEDKAALWHNTPHEISVLPNTILSTLLPPVSPVNSIHHQAIKTLSPHLKPNCLSSADGIIEGIESDSPHPFFLGVQCHPEGLVFGKGTEWQQLFRAFVEATHRCKMSDSASSSSSSLGATTGSS